MSRNGKVIVAMSGGVDSSVAAALLKEQGYDCIGVFMRVGNPGAGHAPAGHGARQSAADAPAGVTARPARHLRHGCCSVEDAQDARAIAGRLGFPFYALNFEADFAQIIDYFVDSYANARTPNPCIVCNTRLKFGKLLRYADMLDAAHVATGHYARVLRPGSGVCRLAQARHLAKDQSYVLFGIPRGDLHRCLFPLGEFADKREVRRIAAELGLRVHDKPESQEICFVPGNDYKRLVRERRPQTRRRGDVLDSDGRVVGEHDGVVNFTIGQRRGLGIATGAPVYITHLNVLNNTVMIGPREALLSVGLVAEEANWLVDPPEPGAWQPGAIKIRHQHKPAPGQYRRLESGGFDARFDEPQTAVTPGQAAVIYGEAGVVIGGGWIVRGIDRA